MPRNRVKLSLRGNCYEVRLSFGGKQLRLGLGLYNTELGTIQAQKVANQIEFDIISGTFSPEKLKAYKPAYQEREQLKKAIELNELIDVVWNYYKLHKDIEETTLKGHYALVDKALEYFPGQSIQKFAQSVNGRYSASVRYQVYRALRTAFNYYQKRVDKSLDNPFSELANEAKEQTEKSKRTKQAFTKSEAIEIIKAFESGKYATPGYEDNDKHYAGLIKFLFNTGCRIEDALALTYDDIKGNIITFSQAYSKGILKGTKNGKIRQFPVTSKIASILNLDTKRGHKELCFPSLTGKHLNLNTFRSRYWARILNGLIQDGLISRYLPLYHTRHTFISIQRDSGIPDAYTANWVETSEAMIVRHYADTLSTEFQPEQI